MRCAGAFRSFGAFEAHRAGARLDEAGKRAQRGGFAGAVRADQRDRLAGAGFEGDAFDRRDAAIGDVEVFDFEERCGHHERPASEWAAFAPR